jgi:hypothetical protein
MAATISDLIKILTSALPPTNKLRICCGYVCRPYSLIAAANHGFILAQLWECYNVTVYPILFPNRPRGGGHGLRTRSERVPGVVTTLLRSSARLISSTYTTVRRQGSQRTRLPQDLARPARASLEISPTTHHLRLLPSSSLKSTPKSLSASSLRTPQCARSLRVSDRAVHSREPTGWAGTILGGTPVCSCLCARRDDDSALPTQPPFSEEKVHSDA